MVTRIAILALLCATMLSVSAQTQPSTTQPAQRAGHKAVVVVLQGEIDDYNRDQLYKHYKEARAVGADTVILSIDTYGGMVTAGLDMSRFIKAQTDLHTIAFVHGKAISAGAMIAMACNEIVMEPTAVVGDCAPIMLNTDGSLNPMPDTERAKMESPILADFRESAERNGHDPLVAEAMVHVDVVVHYIESPDGQRRFVDQADYDKLIADGWKPVDGVPDPVDGPKELLTVHTELAKKIGLCKAVETSPEALAEARGYTILDTFGPSTGDRIVSILNSSFARGLLIALFIISVKIAFSAPGHGAAEAVAVLTLGLVIGVPLLTGYAQWWEIALIFAGLALVAFEIFVFPGHFVSGILGILMVVGGLIMTFVPKEPGGMPGFFPSLSGTYVAMERGLIVVVSGMLSSFLLWLWLQRYLPSIPYFQKLVLSPNAVSTSVTPVIHSTDWPVVGMQGRATTDLYPGGKVAFFDPATGDERIEQVISEGDYIVAGTNVIVREVSGHRIVVRATA